MHPNKEISCADISNNTTDYTEFHIKCFCELNEREYDELLEYRRYSDLNFDLVIGMNELAKITKAYRDATNKPTK